MVTGGLGFIGSHIGERCATLGDEVTLLDNHSRPLGNRQSEYIRAHLSRYGNIRIVQGDVRDRTLLRNLVVDYDVIFHTAGQVAVTWSMDDPIYDFEVNALGTLNLLEAARLSKGDPRLIFCSTNKVYGNNVNSIGVTEAQSRYELATEHCAGVDESMNIDATHHSPYGCSKLTADLYAQDYFHTYGLKTTVFRLSCIYGARQFGLEDQGWLAWLALRSLTDRPITIYGNGKQVRDVLYIDDLVDAFEKASATSNAIGQVFNLGGGPGNTLSILELLDILSELAGKRPEIIFAPWRPADQKVYVSDIGKAGRLLGWLPKITPKEGVVRMVEWIKENLELLP